MGESSALHSCQVGSWEEEGNKFLPSVLGWIFFRLIVFAVSNRAERKAVRKLGVSGRPTPPTPSAAFSFPETKTFRRNKNTSRTFGIPIGNRFRKRRCVYLVIWRYYQNICIRTWDERMMFGRYGIRFYQYSNSLPIARLFVPIYGGHMGTIAIFGLCGA